MGFVLKDAQSSIASSRASCPSELWSKGKKIITTPSSLLAAILFPIILAADKSTNEVSKSKVKTFPEYTCIDGSKYNNSALRLYFNNFETIY